MSGGSSIYIPVREIAPHKENWMICARIIRIWTVTDCRNKSRVLSYEIVFIDRQGDKIQASISKQLVIIKNLHLDEEDFYDMKDVLVVPNDGSDRPSHHPFRLVIERRSLVAKAEPLPYTSYGLSPLNCSDIVWTKFQTEFLMDKLGLVTSVSCEREYIMDDKEIRLAFLEITDPTGKVECVLYDQYVGELIHFLKTNGPCTPIILLQFAEVVPDAQVLFGDVGIKSIPDISRMLFNPPIPEAFDMNGWLTMSGISLEGKIQFRQMEIPCLTLRDEFLLHHKKSDICDLNTNGEGGLFVVCAIITLLLENKAWWYTACRPHACSSKGSSLYTCDGDYSIIPRYYVKVEVCDETALTYLLLGDEHIEKLMQMSCRDMLSKLETTRSTNVHEGCLRVKTLCIDRELIRMWLKGQYFRVDRRPRKTIAAMLGATRNAAPFSHAECSSYASARPVDNFPTASSAAGHQSAGGSASINNNHETNPAPHNTPQVDKHCVHVIQRSQEG
ncbi:Nucleic acid-binding, OB-fold [Sesbania bispinosa]|nr:Nucleic acid-binding, OB-fold [Sesbania bispinosa]